MPEYIYEREDGEIITRIMAVDEMLKAQDKDGRITDEGMKACRRIDLEHGGFHDTPGCWSTPSVSFAMGVSPEDIPEAITRMRSHGISVDFTKEGHAIVRDRAHRRALCKAMGMRDTDAGYGDYAGETR
jgi:hypothetical protein